MRYNAEMNRLLEACLQQARLYYSDYFYVYGSIIREGLKWLQKAEYPEINYEIFSNKWLHEQNQQSVKVDRHVHVGEGNFHGVATPR